MKAAERDAAGPTADAGDRGLVMFAGRPSAEEGSLPSFFASLALPIAVIAMQARAQQWPLQSRDEAQGEIFSLSRNRLLAASL